jgi:hypothetical protein
MPRSSIWNDVSNTASNAATLIIVEEEASPTS